MGPKPLVSSTLAATLLLLLISPGARADSVVCEPQGGGNPFHPITYWYDVTPDNWI